MNRVALAAAILIALAGCAPNTNEAYKECLTVRSAAAGILEPTTQAELAIIAELAERCAAEAKADPARFIDTWTD